MIKEAIHSHFGFEVPVLVKTKNQLQRIFDNCPFSKEKKENSYFTMLYDVPDKELVKVASEKIYVDEEYKIIKDCIYFYCAKGYGKAKFNLSFFEKKLQTSGTARNYKTMIKLLQMLE